MNTAVVESKAELDALATCANEPIHTPGSIQSRGVLLALDRRCERVLFASANAAEHFDLPIGSILGAQAAVVLGDELPLHMRLRLAEVKDGTVLVIDTKPYRTRGGSWLTLVHRFDDRVIVEIIDEAEDVPLDKVLAGAVAGVAGSRRIPTAAAAKADSESMSLASGLQRVASSLVSDPDLLRLCDSTAREVRRITGYDRVMVYQFDTDGHGAVIAEARNDVVESFLGLHYPASDIPSQARVMYLRTRVRVLEHVAAPRIAVLAASNPVAERPLDLTFALLRSISPVHLQYLRNMGVEASLTVSIIVDGQLWGLIACHHMAARWPSFALRSTCDLLSQFISVQVTVQESYARARARASAAAAESVLIRKLMTTGGRLDDVVEELRDMVPCGGLAIVTNSDVHLSGRTPGEARVRALAHWLEHRSAGNIFVSDSMSRVNANFDDINEVASGVLALNVSGAQTGFVLWFRPEQASNVRWAGSLAKTLEISDGAPRLSPRGSFKEWIETRSGFATPWSRDEIAVAEAVRGALVEVVLELLATRHNIVRLEFARIRSAIEAAPLAIAIEDAAGRTAYVNPAFESLSGYGSDVEDAPHRAFRMDESINLRARLTRVDVSMDMIASDGSHIPVALQCQPFVDDAGKRAGTLFMATDLRPMRALENERVRLEQSILQRQKLESLGVLAGGIAHDFNNLLTTIVLNATIALQDLPPGSAAGESIDAITTAADHATLLCRQLLAYAGRGPFSRQTIDINQLLKSMSGLLRTATQSHAIAEYVLSRGIPNIAGDVAQLRQLFMNLIVNASDAIGAVPGKITVTTLLVHADRAYLEAFPHGESLAEKDYIEIRVEDNGCGMSESTMAQLFDPFFTTKFTGRGLGLAAVLGIVRGHMGAIRIVSALGVGTTFTVLLPTVDAALVQAEPVERRRTVRGEGRVILLVDDEPAVQEVTRRLLERSGFHVLLARDGLGALDMIAAATQPIAMIVSDVSMPRLSGVGLLSQLRASNSLLPMLLISGHSSEQPEVSIVNDSRSRFLEKPFTMTQMLDAVGDLLATNARDSETLGH